MVQPLDSPSPSRADALTTWRTSCMSYRPCPTVGRDRPGERSSRSFVTGRTRLVTAHWCAQTTAAPPHVQLGGCADRPRPLLRMSSPLAGRYPKGVSPPGPSGGYPARGMGGVEG